MRKKKQMEIVAKIYIELSDGQDDKIIWYNLMNIMIIYGVY